MATLGTWGVPGGSAAAGGPWGAIQATGSDQGLSPHARGMGAAWWPRRATAPAHHTLLSRQPQPPTDSQAGGGHATLTARLGHLQPGWDPTGCRLRRATAPARHTSLDNHSQPLTARPRHATLTARLGHLQPGWDHTGCRLRDSQSFAAAVCSIWADLADPSLGPVAGPRAPLPGLGAPANLRGRTTRDPAHRWCPSTHT